MQIVETWAQYQSVLQLAAGTNIAITGLLAVYGSEFGREARKISLLIDSSERFRTKISMDHPNEAAFLDEIDRLQKKSRKVKRSSDREEDNSQWYVITGTIVCLVAAFLSLTLLVISSFRPEIPSNESFIGAVILSIPPFIAVSIAAFRYLFVTRQIHSEREKIETDLFLAGKSWLARQT